MEPRYWYALFMMLALVGFLVTKRFVPRPPGYETLDWQARFMLVLCAFIGGALGAKVPFVIGNLLRSGGLPEGPTHLAALNLWLSDGKTIMSGLMGAYLGVELAKLMLGVSIKTGDSFALPLAVAMTIGRWGCFLNGCCFGVPTDLPWGVWFEINGQWVRCHPTQIYESLFHFGMAVVLVILIRRDRLVFHRLQLYLICYCVFRFVTEWIRPEPAWLAGLTFYQWAALVFATFLVGQWCWDSRTLEARPRAVEQALAK